MANAKAECKPNAESTGTTCRPILSLSPHDPCLRNAIANSLTELLKSQQRQTYIQEMIANALKSTDLRDFLTNLTVLEPCNTTINGSFREIIWDKIKSRQIDHHIVCGIRNVTTARKLDYLILGVLQGLQSSTEFDKIIRNTACEMQQSLEQDEVTADPMPSLPLELYSMQLDGTLVEILKGLLKTGQFDDALIIAVTKVLGSGSLDGILLEFLVELHGKVRTQYKCIASFMLQVHRCMNQYKHSAIPLLSLLSCLPNPHCTHHVVCLWGWDIYSFISKSDLCCTLDIVMLNIVLCWIPLQRHAAV